MSEFVVDLHVHPSLKPYSLSHSSADYLQQPADVNHKNSVWYSNPPNISHKALDIFAGVPLYRQTSLTTSAKGRGMILFASLVPFEQGFVKPEKVSEAFGNWLLNLTSQIGKARIERVKSEDHSYFQDLNDEYNFWRQMDDKIVTLADGKKYKYQMVTDFAQILKNQAETNTTGVETINIVLTFEGGNGFGGGKPPYDREPNAQQILDNVETVKNWEKRPFFITFCHHFYNHLCGQCQTFPGRVGQMLNQKYGINTGITQLGYEALELMLLTNRRILIDVKHMSPLGRKQYYDYLNTIDPNGDIPIVASHAAINGLNMMTTRSQHPLFNPAELNLYDEDIIAIARRSGVIGMQLDQRRIASEKELSRAFGNLGRHAMLMKRSRLLWYNLQYIAELLDRNGLPAWDNISIGSDFDGFISCLNGFWSLEQMPLLCEYIGIHAAAYLPKAPLKNAFNRLSPEEIVHKFRSGNAVRLLEENLKG